MSRPHILDTNVLSEIIKADPHPAVMRAIDALPAESLRVTTVTVAEIAYGIARLTPGRRRATLERNVIQALDEGFSAPPLPFDETAAWIYGDIMAARDRLGRPIGSADCQIAAICRSHDAILLTRNVKDFEQIGIPIVDPWESSD